MPRIAPPLRHGILHRIQDTNLTPPRGQVPRATATRRAMFQQFQTEAASGNGRAERRCAPLPDRLGNRPWISQQLSSNLQNRRPKSTLIEYRGVS
jgi:hypothetical protein